MSVFINLSNHPLKNWQENQYEAAMKYGTPTEMAFPDIDPEADESEVEKIVQVYYDRICEMKPAAVMVQGEFSFSFQLVNRLLKKGIKCVTACSARDSIETIMPDGSLQKKSVFRFVKFREYHG